MSDTKKQIWQEHDLLCEAEALIVLAAVKIRNLSVTLERSEIQDKVDRLFEQVQFEREIQGNRVILDHGEDDASDQG